LTFILKIVSVKVFQIKKATKIHVVSLLEYYHGILLWNITTLTSIEGRISNTRRFPCAQLRTL